MTASARPRPRLPGLGADARNVWRGGSAGEISPVEDPVGVVRSEQVEVAVPGVWSQRCCPGEGDVVLADGEAPAEARDRLDVAGKHGVGRDAQGAAGLPG